MYELCALLRAKKPRKPSKPRGKPVKIGSRVWWGPGIGVVVAKNYSANGVCWDFGVECERTGRVWGCSRRILSVVD